MSERTFKLMANKCFVISDYVCGLDYLFGEDECLVLTKTPEEFRERVDYFLANPDDRLGYIERGYNKVMNEHTYFHRVHDIFECLNMPQQAAHVIEVYNSIRPALDQGQIVSI
jgi:spore maturation protein CgeB